MRVHFSYKTFMNDLWSVKISVKSILERQIWFRKLMPFLCFYWPLSFQKGRPLARLPRFIINSPFLYSLLKFNMIVIYWVPDKNLPFFGQLVCILPGTFVLKPNTFCWQKRQAFSRTQGQKRSIRNLWREPSKVDFLLICMAVGNCMVIIQ